MIAIFLDVDGVLNCSQDWNKFKPINNASGTILDPEKIARVLQLQKEFQAEIILSSTWRHYPDMCEALRTMGIEWANITPKGKNRAEEILLALHELHPLISKFVILDDDPTPSRYPTQLAPFHVQTSFSLGFQDEHLEDARQILNAPKTG